jgi:hypothetical protein
MAVEEALEPAGLPTYLAAMEEMWSISSRNRTFYRRRCCSSKDISPITAVADVVIPSHDPNVTFSFTFIH